MVLTVIVVAVFKTTVQLGLAYGKPLWSPSINMPPEACSCAIVGQTACSASARGTDTPVGCPAGVAVSMMMFGTDLLISLAMLIVWQTQVLVAITFFLFFAFLDMSYVSANLEKVPHGGWFALMIAGIVFFPSVLWWWGTHTKRERMTQQKVRPSAALHGAALPSLRLRAAGDVMHVCKVDSQPALDRVAWCKQPLHGASSAADLKPAQGQAGCRKHAPRSPPVFLQVRMQDLLALEAPKPDSDKSPSGALLNAKTHQPLLRLPSVGLMYSETLTGAPPLLPVLVNRWGGLHKLLIFVTVRHVSAA